MEEVDLQAEDTEEVEEMGMTQGMEMKRRMRMTLCPLRLKIREKFSPQRLDRWIQRMMGAPGGGGPPDEPDPDYDDPYDWLGGPRGHRGRAG